MKNENKNKQIPYCENISNQIKTAKSDTPNTYLYEHPLS